MSDHDVLVVGAGPTGLLAACELLRRGVRVRIVDRAHRPADAPKALSLWPRAQDILEDLGLGEGLRAASVPIRRYGYFSDGRPVASFAIPAEHAAVNLPQYETERLLTERLHELGGKVERGVRLSAVDDIRGSIAATDGVSALLEHADGTVERTRTPFLIGADGAGSTVREQLGIGFEGSTYEMAFALVDARVEGRLPPDGILYYQAPSGTLVIVPLPDGVFRILSVLPGRDRKPGAAMMQALLDERGPGGVRITEPVWETVFTVHARSATHFRRGRVFLAGDAAHVHSPAGGQGMNNGLQDAHNLGWKLAAVIHGHSPDSLLLGYGPERAEATRRIVRDTDLQTRAWMADGPLRVRARDAAFRLLERTGAVSRFYAPVMAGRRLAYAPVRESQSPSLPSGCRIRGRLPGGLTAGALFPRRLALAYGIAGPASDPAGWTVAVLPPATGPWTDRVEHLARQWPQIRVVLLRRGEAAEATGCGRSGYYLIRPDGHIAAHGHARDLHRLEAELAVWRGRRQ
ncbi:monooxygenase [Streptomyces sp. NRRL B-1568]|nr:monooxygenase [Streptomyces sp. NRRL B-1568]